MQTAPPRSYPHSSGDQSRQKPFNDVVNRANRSQVSGDTASDRDGSVNLAANHPPHTPTSSVGPYIPSRTKNCPVLGHDIPDGIEVIESLKMEAELDATTRVESWRYNVSPAYKNREIATPSLTGELPALENKDHFYIPDSVQEVKSFEMKAEPDFMSKVESWRHNVSSELEGRETTAPAPIGNPCPALGDNNIPNVAEATESLGMEEESEATIRVDSWRYNTGSPMLKGGGVAVSSLIRIHPTVEEKCGTDVPNGFDATKSLGMEAEPDVMIRVESWRNNVSLVSRHGEPLDIALFDRERKLVHSGKLLRRRGSVLGWNEWNEVFVLLFNDCLLVTSPKETDGVVKYVVEKRPLPLDLLTLTNFTDTPTLRSTGIFRGVCGLNYTKHIDASQDPAALSRDIYPMTFHHNGREGGPDVLYAESAKSRTEWHVKLINTLEMHKAARESNKVFKFETLSADTFLVPSKATPASGPAQDQDQVFTGRVTCSVPFSAPDGGKLVAVGCAEGVWVGFNHNPGSFRRVLHLKQVTQCAILNDFGIFLVLADQSLFAYNIEVLMPSPPPHLIHQDAPRVLNKNKDIHFFSVGTVHGKSLVVYMRKKNMDSIFRVLEPVGVQIDKGINAPASDFGFRTTRLDHFRVYRDFFLPHETLDVVFLKARIAILCSRYFHIMDIDAFESVTIPQCKEPRLSHIAKRCKSCRPVGMLRSSDDEFLLCYNEFGLYVDKHGDPSRPAWTIEWEGTAERVALHHPYILIFDSRFIEVRHIETGRLAQIIPGNDIRCTWDERCTGKKSLSIGQNLGGEARVHVVMSGPEQIPMSGLKPMATAQCIFELVPAGSSYPPNPSIFKF